MARRLVRGAVIAGALAGLWAGFAPTAHAYIDPGSGSYLIQVILGAIFGVGVAIATFWQRVRAFVSRLLGRKPSQAETDETTSPQTTRAEGS